MECEVTVTLTITDSGQGLKSRGASRTITESKKTTTGDNSLYYAEHCHFAMQELVEQIELATQARYGDIRKSRVKGL